MTDDQMGVSSGRGLSIVIPCRNASATLDRQLKALSQQSWDKQWEVIIVDNGSTDDTVAKALAWTNRLPQLQVVEARRRSGASVARNEGARVARHEMLAWIDADDEVAPGWLAAMGRAAQSFDFMCATEQQAGAVSSGAQLGRPAATRFSRIFGDRGFLDACGGGCLAVTRQLFDMAGGWDEDMMAAEDTAFCWEIQLLGASLVRIHDARINVYSRTNLRGLARQQFNWGVGSVQLYKRFAARGAPRSNSIGVTLRWVALLATTPYVLVSARYRRRWTGTVARRLGKLIGCFRLRTFCP
jgi:glycosyltransferase involved in cell wall biosynthesis